MSQSNDNALKSAGRVDDVDLPRGRYDYYALAADTVEWLRDNPDAWVTAESVARQLGQSESGGAHHRPVEAVRVVLVTLSNEWLVALDSDGEHRWYQWVGPPQDPARCAECGAEVYARRERGAGVGRNWPCGCRVEVSAVTEMTSNTPGENPPGE